MSTFSPQQWKEISDNARSLAARAVAAEAKLAHVEAERDALAGYLASANHFVACGKGITRYWSMAEQCVFWQVRDISTRFFDLQSAIAAAEKMGEK